MTPSASLWLIGSGPMAQAYAAVLQAQGVAFTVIGRSGRFRRSLQPGNWGACGGRRPGGRSSRATCT
jgi:hypothetical protein